MLTLSEAKEAFLLEDRSPATTRSYRQVLDKAFAVFGLERDVNEVTRADILQYIKLLRSQPSRYDVHPRRPQEEGGLSPYTIQKHGQVLTSFFSWLQENGYREDNPAAKLRLRRPKRPLGTSKAVTQEELAEMLKVAEAKAALGRPLHLAVLMFLATTGSRAGEASTLTLANLRLDEYAAWVHGKGDKLRPVFYGDQTVAALSAWLKQHPNPIPSETVFQLQVRSISTVVSRLAQAAGIERPINAHAIRHRVGQAWGVWTSPEAVQMKLGHEGLATILPYLNTPWDEIQKNSRQYEMAAINGFPKEQKHLTPPNLVLLQKSKTG